MREADEREPVRRLPGRRLRPRDARRIHRIEKWQRNTGSRAAQYGSTRKVLLG
jgi:hypothetical protein